MGWVGWTKAQTLEHTPQDIQLAKDGRVEMLNLVIKAMTGAGPAPTKTLAGRSLDATAPDSADARQVAGLAPSVENFRALFDSFGRGS